MVKTLQVDERVTPFKSQDYPEWHKGRANFGLWYIEIENPIIIDHCQHLQKKSQAFLNPHYKRQFHITLFVNGFWVGQKRFFDDFCQADLDLQINVLKNLAITPFTVTLDKLDSFQNCLFIKVLDNNQQLKQIRQALQKTTQEISPPDYQPHITLGLYQDSFLMTDILDFCQNVNTQQIDFTVKKLKFGTYQATDLQGKLTSIFEWDLL